MFLAAWRCVCEYDRTNNEAIPFFLVSPQPLTATPIIAVLIA